MPLHLKHNRVKSCQTRRFFLLTIQTVQTVALSWNLHFSWRACGNTISELHNLSFDGFLALCLNQNFRTDKSKQNSVNLIRRLLSDCSSLPPEEQSDQCLHCLPFRLHLFDTLLYGKSLLVKVLDNYSIVSGVRIFRNVTVIAHLFSQPLQGTVYQLVPSPSLVHELGTVLSFQLVLQL